MNFSVMERLLHSIGDIEDFFLEEAATADVAISKIAKRKKIAKYSAAGLAVSVGVAAVAYWMIRNNKAAA